MVNRNNFNLKSKILVNHLFQTARFESVLMSLNFYWYLLEFKLFTGFKFDSNTSVEHLDLNKTSTLKNIFISVLWRSEHFSRTETRQQNNRLIRKCGIPRLFLYKAAGKYTKYTF